MRILVTGGSGFVGAAAAASLANAGHEVTITTRGDAAPPAADGLADVITGCDLAHPGCATRLPVQIDLVVHSAALAEFREHDWKQHLRNNVAATRNVARWGERAGATRIIFMSTIGVHDRQWGRVGSEPITETSARAATSAYGRSKCMAEKIIADTSTPSTILRLTWVYGNAMRRSSHIRALARMVHEHSVLRYLPLPGRVSTIDVRDVATAAREVAERSHEMPENDVILLAENQPVALREILDPGPPSRGRAPGRLRGGVASVLPFGLRVLVDDALVAAPTRMHARGLTCTHRFRDEYPLLLAENGWLA